MTYQREKHAIRGLFRHSQPYPRRPLGSDRRTVSELKRMSYVCAALQAAVGLEVPSCYSGQ